MLPRQASARPSLLDCGFDEGVTDFLQVLDAERTLLEAQDRLAVGRTDAVTAFVELYRSLGGVWPLEGGGAP